MHSWHCPGGEIFRTAFACSNISKLAMWGGRGLRPPPPRAEPDGSGKIGQGGLMALELTLHFINLSLGGILLIPELVRRWRSGYGAGRASGSGAAVPASCQFGQALGQRPLQNAHATHHIGFGPGCTPFIRSSNSSRLVMPSLCNSWWSSCSSFRPWQKPRGCLFMNCSCCCCIRRTSSEDLRLPGLLPVHFSWFRAASSEGLLPLSAPHLPVGEGGSGAGSP